MGGCAWYLSSLMRSEEGKWLRWAQLRVEAWVRYRLLDRLVRIIDTAEEMAAVKIRRELM